MIKPIKCRRSQAESLDRRFRVWKITDWDGCDCVLGYLTFKLFSPDGRYLFFASNRSGEYQLYRLDLERQEAAQITGVDGAHAFAGMPTEGKWRDSNVHFQRKEFAYCTAERLIIADIESLEHRTLAVCPPEWEKFDATPQFSGDGVRFCTVFQTHDGRRGVAVANVPGKNDGPAELKVAHLWPEGEHVGYLITPPTEDFMISVCAGRGDRQNDPNASREERARAWILDPESGEVSPYLVMPVGLRATHQYWGPGGRLYYHKKTVPTWTPTWICSIDLYGKDERTHYGSEDRKLGHSCVAPDASWLVTDVQEPGDNELIFVDLKTGEDAIICWPNSSCASNSQNGHVHPSIDFQSRRVAFQSDRDGNTALYLVDVCD